MQSSTCKQDAEFGPAVSGCRRNFDFTITFEQSILSILPSALFVLAAIPWVIWSARRPIVIHAPRLQWTKLGAIVLYASLKLALLALLARRPLGAYDVAVASGTLQLTAATCMLPLSFLDHGRSARPSVLLNSYLFFTLLPDIARTRTYWLVADSRSITHEAAVFTASLAVKFCILLLEAQQKAKWLDREAKASHSPEEASGIYSLGLYGWLNRLFFYGYRNALRMDDLYPLDQAIGAKKLTDRFHAHSRSGNGRYVLARNIARTLLGAILAPALPRVALIGFKFCQPFLFSAILQFLSKAKDQVSPSHGSGLVGATLLVYSGIAISTALYWYFHFRMLQMARGILVTAIYDKTTRLSAGSFDDAVTLMSVDIERINLGFQTLHEIWAGSVEVGVASFLLYREVGIAFVASLVVAIVCSLIVTVVAKLTGRAQQAWMSRIQKRVSLTATAIAGMKSIKMAGLATSISDTIQTARLEELRRSSRVRQIMITGAVTSFGTMLIAPVITFALTQRHLDSETLYTSLSYIIILATPLYVVLKAIPQMAIGFACLGRIQDFLARANTEDFRQRTSPTSFEKPAEAGPNSGNALVVEHASFGWTKDTPVIRNATMHIPAGALTMVVGPVASGKSTLCKALLAEVPIHDGIVVTDSLLRRVAYCDQSPFLVNSSVRENIIGDTPFDAKRYAQAVEATMLDIDLRALPQGEWTSVGSNGVTLSGGQRQRIALARALYLHSDMLILDDILSGLDATTEEQVFARVFGPQGVLRKRKATAVFCTNSLRQLPAADHVITISAEGTVKEESHPQQTMRQGMHPNDLDVETWDAASIDDHGSSQQSSEDEKSSLEWQSSSEPTHNAKDTEVVSAKGDRRVYKIYCQSMGVPLAIAQLCVTAVFGFTYNFPTIWLQFWSNQVGQTNPTHSSSYYVGIYGMLNVSCLLAMSLLGFLVWVRSVRKAGANLHYNALRTLVHAPLSYLASTDQGVILNLFSQDLNLVDTELPNALLNTLLNLAIAVGQAAVMAVATPYVAISYPLLLALIWVLQKFYLRTSRRMRILDLEAKSPLYTHFLDTANGIVTHRAFGFLPEHRQKNMELLDDSQRPAYLLFMIQQWLTLVFGLVVMALAVIIVALAVKLRATSGFTGASLVTLMNFGDYLASIVMQWTKLETSIGAVGRLRTFSDTAGSEDLAHECVKPGEEWPTSGCVRMQNVSASYGLKSGNEKENLALKNVSLSVSSGEKVAVCGRSGSGKSSLMALLLKLLDPCNDASTKIDIDGQALQTIDRTTLRRRLIAMPQEAALLPEGGSFRQNLDPFDRASFDQCERVLQDVGLWTHVGSRGGVNAEMVLNGLSQGQTQLFSLAQAILRWRIRRSSAGPSGAPGGILLLDEITSMVDHETEQLMQELIRREFEGCTVIAVSHRLGPIMDFDKVIVMDQGEVVEVGNPAELVRVGSSRFGALWKAAGGI